MPVNQAVRVIAPPVNFSQTLSLAEQGYRSFPVVDTAGVEVPGCLSIEELLLDNHLMPTHQDHDVPIDTTEKHFETLRFLNYQLLDGPTGVPTVVRGQNSNDGRWQIGSTVSIKGEWGEVKAQPKDEFSDMSYPDLQAKAKDLDIPPNQKKDALLVAIRAAVAAKQD